MGGRIHSIDAVRGLCLINIFVNHVSLGVLDELSPSKVTFSDSADIFVLLAGISCYLAYGPRDSNWSCAAAGRRMWRRALTLWLANFGLIAASFLVLLLGEAGAPPPAADRTQLALISADGPANFLWQTLSLQQSVGYSMVLRLYVALMLIAPLYIWLAARRFWYPLVPAGLLWLVGGHFLLGDRDAITGALLSMTILPWQLLFAGGIALGGAIVQRVELPRDPLLLAAALALLLGGTALLVAGPHFSETVRLWLEGRNDAFWLGISKTYQSPLRLLYTAALVYSFMALKDAPLVRLAHRAGPDSFLCRLGRHSLPIFCFGAVAALAENQALWNLTARGAIVPGSAGALAIEILSFALVLGTMGWIVTTSRRKMVTPAGFEPAAY